MSFIHEMLDMWEPEEINDEINRSRYAMMVRQDIWWHPQGQPNEMMVKDMDVTHVHNLIHWMERNFDHYQERFCLFGAIPLEEAPLYIRLKERLNELMGGFEVDFT